MNRWTLTKELENEFGPVITEFIEEVEKVEQEESLVMLEKDLSDTSLNPYTLCKLLEKLGYKKIDQHDNGWELDFWITFEHPVYRQLQVKGCGMTFELTLSETDV